MSDVTDGLAATARSYVHRAVKSGRLRREPCIECGAEKVEAHHLHGYEPEFALDVVWLCRTHHKVKHDRRRASRPTRHWSWSRLVAEHGEEAALALLQYQPGLGRYAEDCYTMTNSADPRTPPPLDVEVHDEAPHPDLTPVFDLDFDAGYTDGRRPYFGYDVGQRCGVPWSGYDSKGAA